MTHPILNQKATLSFTYPDAVHAFNDHNIQADLAQACEKLAKATASLLSKFDAIAAQVHKLGVNGNAPSDLRARWSCMHRDFQQLMWQTRTNASFISGRLKLFSASVLPLVARDASRSASRRLVDEKLQVTLSFTSISADNANLTQSLACRTVQFCTALNTVLRELVKSAEQKNGDSQKELYHLVRKLSDLDSTVQQVCAANVKLAMPDIAHLVYSVFRIIATSLRKPGRSKVCYKRVSLRRDASTIGSLYEQLDQTYNEVAHAQYAVQTGPARSEAVVAHLASLVCEALLMTESVISLFLATWSRLQCDCTEILCWLKGTGENGPLPACVSVYVEQGKTLYPGIASALDVFVTELEPSWFTQLSQK